LNNYALIAKIISIYNEKGYLKVQPNPGFESSLFKRQFVFADVFGAPRKFFVEDVFEVGKFLAVKFKNFDSPDEVAFLKGKDLIVSSREVKSAGEDVFLLSELKKLVVYRNNVFFGKVKDILNFKANDVLVIENEKGKEILIPFVEEFIKNIDVEKGRMDLTDSEEDLFDDAD
jgi:16S rRNA processing protein RimM